MLASFLELYKILDSLDFAAIIVKIGIIIITIISFVSLDASVLCPSST